MFVYRENALKAHQHISYCSILVNLKKKNFIQNLIKTYQIAHFQKKFLAR